MNLYFGSSISGDTYDTIINWEKCVLPGDVALPVTVVTETLRAFEAVERRRSEEEALRLGETVLEERLAGLLEEGTVLSRELTGEIAGDTLLVTLCAECEEQIGKFVAIPKE